MDDPLFILILIFFEDVTVAVKWLEPFIAITSSRVESAATSSRNFDISQQIRAERFLFQSFSSYFTTLFWHKSTWVVPGKICVHFDSTWYHYLTKPYLRKLTSPPRRGFSYPSSAGCRLTSLPYTRYLWPDYATIKLGIVVIVIAVVFWDHFSWPVPLPFLKLYFFLFTPYKCAFFLSFCFLSLLLPHSLLPFLIFSLAFKFPNV